MFNTLFKKSRPQIDLVIPGLFDLPLYELDEIRLQQQTPALHRLLRFARREKNNCFNIDDILINSLGLQQKNLPYAHACEAVESGYGVLFKPVHLKADINNALVFPVTESKANIDLLINDLAEYFKVDFTIQPLSQGLFFMHLLQQQPILEVPHYLSATGKKVTHYLEQAKSNLAWFKLFNEIQMFLFQHPINQQRQQQGLPEINSIWCWGADAWQGETFSNRQWFSDESEMQALGQLYCASSGNLNDISSREIPGDATVVDLSLINSLKGHSQQSLFELLMNIEQSYLQGLLVRKTHQLRLLTGGAFNLRLTHAMTYRVWKKPTSLAQQATPTWRSR